jgi:hypothetical protein
VESSDIPNRLLVPIPVECVLGIERRRTIGARLYGEGPKKSKPLTKALLGDSNVKLGPSAFNEFQLVRIVLCSWYKFQCFSANKVPP